MAIKSSPEVVREMKSTLQTTIKEIQAIQNNVKGAIRASSSWDDSQGKKYQELMKQISKLTESPMSTLQNAIPKLEKLAQSLDNYVKVKF